MPRKSERPKTAFGKRLEEACEDIGLSPTRLTSILKMPTGYVSELQRKDGNAISTYPRWAFQLVAILGVRWEWLFYGEEPKWPPNGPCTPQQAGIVIALLEDAAANPTHRMNPAIIEEALKRLAASGFVTDRAWEWSEAIRRERVAIESAAHAAAYRKTVERSRELETTKAQRRIRTHAERRKKKLEATDPKPAPPPASERALPRSRRMGRTKTR